ncbi:hypothetical protein GCM10009850_076900 [Nonomuraea monospora]|uniref:Uncharacterized protein n=1 Tax=Nonomuraea monospora TaxID=568818 RepID=A0ABN3CRY7_9ACTN
MTGNTAYICRAVPGSSRQLRPSYVTCETFCPAPKQSKTVHPGNPRSRNRVWIEQRKSSLRLWQGCPPALSTAKSAEAENGRATQHSPKQLSQSASRPSSRGFVTHS